MVGGRGNKGLECSCLGLILGPLPSLRIETYPLQTKFMIGGALFQG